MSFEHATHPPAVDAKTAARFWAKVALPSDPDGCLLWIGAAHNAGYGNFWNGVRTMGAHRFAYEMLVSPVPSGMQLDHLCRTPACVNPNHLEPVTQRENLLRGVSPQADNVRKTHCPLGHPYNEVNTYRHVRGDRQCRECKRVRRTARNGVA